MLKLSYSANGLIKLDLFSAIDETEKAGYQGIELFFEKKNFNPFTMKEGDILKIKNYFSNKKIKPVAISTATICFLSDIPHEPSLISLDDKARQERINLIKKGIDIAKKLNIPIVSFQSGYLRAEHLGKDNDHIMAMLVEGIHECLNDVEKITLVIEPEPGMYIETLDDAVNLIKKVGSDNFKLHLDICHAYCTENNYVKAIGNAMPYIKYMHLADIKEGYNLRLINIEKSASLDLSFAGYVLYSCYEDIFLFIDRNHFICFSFDLLSSEDRQRIEKMALKVDSNQKLKYQVIPDDLGSVNVSVSLENKAFLDSVGGVSFQILKKSKKVLDYLRGGFNVQDTCIIDQPICNTIKGKVHYHEIPGDGEIDFKSVLAVIYKSGYNGYITVELYNHSDIWDTLLPNVRKYLLDCMSSQIK